MLNVPRSFGLPAMLHLLAGQLACPPSLWREPLVRTHAAKYFNKEYKVQFDNMTLIAALFGQYVDNYSSIS